MKKGTIQIFILCCSLILVACGSSTGSSQDSNTTEDENLENSKTEAAPEIDDDSEELILSYADALKQGLPEMTEYQSELSQESYDFVKNNADLFPAKEEGTIKAAKDKSETIDIKLLNKNLQPYYSKIASFEGYVVQVQEENYEGETVSQLNIYDNGYNHIVIMFKSSGDILEEDYVKFWGIPVANYSYETLDGGFQNAIIFFGSHIEKKQI